jgi:hypothetical protein
MISNSNSHYDLLAEAPARLFRRVEQTEGRRKIRCSIAQPSPDLKSRLNMGGATNGRTHVPACQTLNDAHKFRNPVDKSRGSRHFDLQIAMVEPVRIVKRSIASRWVNALLEDLPPIIFRIQPQQLLGCWIPRARLQGVSDENRARRLGRTVVYKERSSTIFPHRLRRVALHLPARRSRQRANVIH